MYIYITDDRGAMPMTEHLSAPCLISNKRKFRHDKKAQNQLVLAVMVN